ncbi:sensor histidine kinase [Nonomuraea sp. MTCD27]|uniref:sensor histidine kinase n=1 Tax=Nonomuraea sp. MTCD27 TaxID=1676747 RepID=UPI0035BED80D
MATRPETARKILLYWMDGSVALMALMYVVLMLAAVVEGRLSIPQMVLVLVLLAGFLGLFPLILRAAFEHRPKPSPRLLIAGLLSVALMLQFGDETAVWVDTSMLWLALAALHLRPWTTVWLSATVVSAITVYVVLITGRSWPGVLAAEAFNAVMMILAMLLWRWLWWVIRDAHKSREARARLAVAEERLRFARDLHDLLGRSLSVITLKSELAAKLATKDVDRAAEEMAMVRRLAGESLFEVQQAVHGYQELDLDAELVGLRAALEAAGADCAIEASVDDLPPPARALLAWAVREGGTNVLKHSTATRCAIRIDGGVLEIRNDGVTAHSAAPGNGLRGLSERLVTAGGSVTAGPTPDGEFLLRAAVPA